MSEFTIRTLNNTDQAALEAFLLPRIETSMFLLNNSRLAGLEYTGKRYQGLYAAAFKDDQMVGVVSQFWNGNLNMQAPVHLEPLVHHVVTESNLEIGRVKGVIGPADQVQQTIDTLQLELNETTVQVDEPEHLYALNLDDLKLPPALANNEVVGRRMEHRDLNTVAEWTYQYRVEAVNDKPGKALRDRCTSDMEKAIADDRRWVLEDATSGELIALTGFNAMTKEAVQVGGVWTPHANRNKGYAKCAVAASLRDKHIDGVPQSILFTGLNNLPAQKAYEAIGFERIGAYRILMFW